MEKLQSNSINKKQNGLDQSENEKIIHPPRRTYTYIIIIIIIILWLTSTSTINYSHVAKKKI